MSTQDFGSSRVNSLSSAARDLIVVIIVNVILADKKVRLTQGNFNGDEMGLTDYCRRHILSL
jgi:hypothetical protein